MKFSSLKYPFLVTVSLGLVTAVYFNASQITSTESFKIGTRPVQVCGGVYHELDVSTSANITIRYKNQYTSGGALLVVPDEVVDLRNAPTSALIALGSGQVALPKGQKLLPLPRPLTSDPRLLDEYCRKVKQFATTVSTTNVNINTKVMQLNAGPNGIQGNASGVVMVEKATALAAPVAMMKMGMAIAPSVPQTKHVVIYDPAYQAEAIALSSYRSSKGIPSIAVNVTSLPGYNPADSIPYDCQGVYQNECYLNLNGVDTVDLASAEMLVGMRTGRLVGQAMPTKVVDVAGIIRAGLRKLKRENPQLSYVVLLGHPSVLPPRFTGVDDYESTWGINSNFTLPTDVYFQEISLPWRLNAKMSNASISPLIYANGTNDGAGNSDWDTTHFVWPVNSPRARSMDFPLYYQGWNATVQSNVLAVGRITAKAESGKDYDVASFVNKLAFYESHLPALSNNIVATADGVFEYSHFNGFKNQLGNFYFWSEGFGTGFVSQAAMSSYPAACNHSNVPLTNTWTAMQGKSTYNFQNGTANCKPMDPAVNDGRRLPNPNEIRSRIQTHGYAFLFFEGHGGEVGIGLNTGANGWEPGRGFISPLVTNNTPGIDLEVDGMNSNKAQGFVVASSCSVGPFLGKKYDPYKWNKFKTLAESLITTPDVGSVGAYLNYSVGWFGSDPAHEMALLAKIKAANAATGTNRIGDAIKDLVINNIKNVSQPNWATINRFYHGDPATLIAQRPFDPNQPAKVQKNVSNY